MKQAAGCYSIYHTPSIQHECSNLDAICLCWQFIIFSCPEKSICIRLLVCTHRLNHAHNWDITADRNHRSAVWRSRGYDVQYSFNICQEDQFNVDFGLCSLFSFILTNMNQVQQASQLVHNMIPSTLRPSIWTYSITIRE